jgi:hypothetical protein
MEGQIAPHPSAVTGPRQGVFPATTTHAFPARLHSKHTALVGSLGLAPLAMATRNCTSCPLLTGHPLSSASTLTKSLTGRDFAIALAAFCSGYEAASKSLMLPQFLSAWMPPAVAQAPIATRVPDSLRMRMILSTSSAVVIDPSTRARS